MPKHNKPLSSFVAVAIRTMDKRCLNLFYILRKIFVLKQKPNPIKVFRDGLSLHFG